MKVILINAENKTITEAEIEKGYPDGNKLIGADLITVAGNKWNHDLIVDDEGLLRNPRFFFRIRDFYPYPCAGNGFICQVTKDGDWKSHKLAIEMLKSRVEWFDSQCPADYAKLSNA